MTHRLRSLLVALALIALTDIAAAQVPQTIALHGTLTAGCIGCQQTLTFTIHSDSARSTPLWSETRSVQVDSRRGFNVVLGTVTPMSLPFDQQYWVEVTHGTIGVVAPRFRLAASPYSIRSSFAESIGGSSVSSATIQDSSIATIDLADGAVTSAKIADGTIRTVDLADSMIADWRLTSNVARLNGTNSFTGANTFTTGLSAGGARLTSVGRPTAPTDAANRGYVDSIETAVRGSVWSLTGNSITAAQRLGTTNAQDLRLMAGNVTRLTIDDVSGNVGIGALPAATARLSVDSAINTGTEYRIGGNRVLATPAIDVLSIGRSAGMVGDGSAFIGTGAGAASVTGGNWNTFIGTRSGFRNTTGVENVIIGYEAGANNITGGANTIIGTGAGFSLTTSNNTIVGAYAGYQIRTGTQNTFIGTTAGYNNWSGSSNTTLGEGAGRSLVTGSFNTMIGAGSGFSVDSASTNTLIGFNADASDGVSNATAIGANTLVTRSNSLVLGSTFDPTRALNVGIHTTAPRAPLHVGGRVYVESNGQGIILKSPSGSCFEITVSDAGTLTTSSITCP